MGRNRTSPSDLPPNVYLKCGSYYFVTPPPHRQWVNLGKDKAALSYLMSELATRFQSAERETPACSPKISRAYHSCKAGAKDRGLQFNITRRNIEDLYNAAKGKCQVTGIEFSDRRIGKSNKQPFAPSIDRIDSTKGYTPDNIRLVCVAVNFAMSDWGEEVIIEIIRHGYKSIFTDQPLIRSE